MADLNINIFQEIVCILRKNTSAISKAEDLIDLLLEKVPRGAYMDTVIVFILSCNRDYGTFECMGDSKITCRVNDRDVSSAYASEFVEEAFRKDVYKALEKGRINKAAKVISRCMDDDFMDSGSYRSYVYRIAIFMDVVTNFRLTILARVNRSKLGVDLS